jgi:hypothetical protein
MAEKLDNNDKVLQILKAYTSPILLTIVATFLWRDVSEMRSDIKILLLQQSANRVKMEVMESDIALLKAITLTPDAVNKHYLKQPAKKEDEQIIPES